jgi:tetratricopeptide (TPR) repeat protein
LCIIALLEDSERQMTKTGRNQPCPCGSGKKYKICCLRRDQAVQAERAAQAERAKPLPPSQKPGVLVEDDDLDQLDARSNLVVDLIRDGRLDEAEAAAQDLVTRYPEFPDGPMRLAMVCEARKQPELAAAHYREAAACLDDDCEELRASLLNQANGLMPLK